MGAEANHKFIQLRGTQKSSPQGITEIKPQKTRLLFFHFLPSFPPSLVFLSFLFEEEYRKKAESGREIKDKMKIKGGCGNDPSAGSPTETLLRLHLPLDDEV